VIPSNHQLVLPNLLVSVLEIDHVLHRRVSGVDTGFGTLDGQGEGIHDDERSILDLADHQAHDLVLTSRSGVNDLQSFDKDSWVERRKDGCLGGLKSYHFDESNCRDLDFLEIRRAVFRARR
jgi:hypothetical protein